MSSRPELKLDWCSYEAAKYAVEKWHYSRKIPRGKLLRIGVWEGGRFIGVLIFSYGASNNLLKPYGLKITEGCELTRIALSSHKTPVSRILAIALRMLKTSNPGIRLVISFADTGQNHHGGIYQATNWIYSGRTNPADRFYKINGEKIHPRSVGSKYKTRSIPVLRGIGINVSLCDSEPKYRYLMPLDKEIRKRIEPLRKPYPKRVRSIDGDAPANQAGEGGSTPTRTLEE